MFPVTTASTLIIDLNNLKREGKVIPTTRFQNCERFKIEIDNGNIFFTLGTSSNWEVIDITVESWSGTWTPSTPTNNDQISTSLFEILIKEL